MSTTSITLRHQRICDRAPADTVLPLFSAPRTQGYLDACGGDPTAALELYRWNAAVSGAFWEMLSHLEIVLRNVLANRLAAQHAAAGRAGPWLDDTAGELDIRARKDIAQGPPTGPGEGQDGK
ncbi:hypothetical protein [Haloactinomyces albus]|uniref:Uncharacterized protein n=1 Tax=Haloactinomyces albus TaxID=1352928 RepID=A0AAE4CNL1_9ACTN|nr:hypothetical protein [Haloactinomyces albus]MDR7304555.1 hypothetical protein [Haloactinomyces albus]